MKSIFKSGDTIIEVLLAVTVFTMLMVGSMSMMNAGLARSQATLQLTMARNAIDTQAEALRFMNSAFISQYTEAGTLTGPARQWQLLTANTANNASPLTECRSNFNSNNIFIIDYDNMAYRRTNPTANFRSASTYPRLVYNTTDTNRIISRGDYSASEGIWIEAIRTSSSNNYYDFHIRACWTPSGSNVPTTLGTIVRLYDPR